MRNMLDKTNQKLKNIERKNNKGFTLVELIIVIAIIAVLAAVLAPQYIKYVEKSRISVDENAVAEVKHVVEVAISNEDVYTELGTTGATILVSSKSIGDGTNSYNDEGTVTGTLTKLETEIQAAVPKAPEFKSNAHKDEGSDVYTITVAYVEATKSYTVSGVWG